MAATKTSLLRRFSPGEQIGKYTVIEGPERIRGGQYYRCVCECRRVCYVGSQHLRDGANRGPDKRPVSCRECSILARYGPKVVQADQTKPTEVDRKPMGGYSRWRKA